MQNFTVQVGSLTDNGQVDYKDCYYHAGSAGSIVNVTCSPPMCGRYVRIIKQDDDDSALTLCEVQVFGMLLEPDTSCTVMSTEETSTLTHPGVSTATNGKPVSSSAAAAATAAAAASSSSSSSSSSLLSSSSSSPPPSTSTATMTTTTASLSTTSPQTRNAYTTMAFRETPPASHSRCCRCVFGASRNNTEQAIAAAEKNMKEVKKFLFVNRTETSQSLRKKTSADDERKSSKTGGLAAIVILTCIGVFFVLFDCISCVKGICTRSRVYKV
ncbi:uncharacterized protein [Littorina saxatilis]|uniref:uncharacterized protein n=1 Tax=Littorina saxatilis TaxID=31220 RepID=UPI0038B63958